jgi:hypothetical protein
MTALRKPVVWYRDRYWWTPEDVFFSEYPKSGITWLRFLLYEALTRRPATWPDVDETVIDRSYAAPVLSGGGRVIPTHEPYRSRYRKAVYLARDARDIASSEYNFVKALGIFTGDFDAFVRAFVKGHINPYVIETHFGAAMQRLGYTLSRDLGPEEMPATAVRR